MTHLSVREWGKVPIKTAPAEDAFTIREAEALVAAAKAHPLGGKDGTEIIADHRHYLKAQQMVGVIAASECSLEILPKVDPDAPDEDAPTVRARLVNLLDLALGLDIRGGETAALARGAESLLDILIRIFADRLLTETRRGLPRRYVGVEGDLTAVRGRLDVTRQFTQNAVRPDRLACRYDELSHNIPLMQIMAAAVNRRRKLTPFRRAKLTPLDGRAGDFGGPRKWVSCGV